MVREQVYQRVMQREMSLEIRILLAEWQDVSRDHLILYTILVVI